MAGVRSQALSVITWMLAIGLPPLGADRGATTHKT
jgi:hypothetical protein